MTRPGAPALPYPFISHVNAGDPVVGLGAWLLAEGCDNRSQAEISAYRQLAREKSWRYQHDTADQG